MSGAASVQAGDTTTAWPTEAERAGRTAIVARALVDAGKVVPTMVVDDHGVARSRWVPLPGAGDVDSLRGLLGGDDLADHLAAADALAEETDRLVRERLDGVDLLPRRGGRRSVPQAWIESLGRADSELPPSLDPVRVAAFADLVDDWVVTGAVSLGRGRLCLRVHEPGSHPDAPERPGRTGSSRGADRRGRTGSEPPWWIEVMVRDAEEPSLVVSMADLWAGRSPLPVDTLEEVLTSLGRMVAVAPEVAGIVDGEVPTGVAISTGDLLDFVDRRLAALDEAGIDVLLPSWWANRRRVGLRARAKAGAAPKGGIDSGLDFDSLVDFTWEAALGDQRLTASDLRKLAAAAEAKVPLVQVRGEWVRVDGAEVAALLARAGRRSVARLGDVVRATVGLVDLDALDPAAGESGSTSRSGRSTGRGHGTSADGPVEVVAGGWLGRILDDVRNATATPVPTPSAFVGELRPYQERGVGWLCFLGRFGFGACLADDMGLGKTAQLIATILADPVDGPTLVICPVSVMGNWARELERFAPDLSVMVHHGADRHHDAVPFAERAAAVDVVVCTYSLLARDLDALASVAWGRVAFDEAQQVKNPGTATARAARSIRASRRIALTGTPVENRLAELWSIMQILNPGLLGSQTHFVDTFARPIERDGDPEVTEDLQRRIAPFVLRRLKSDKSIIDDLPDKIETTDRCALTREQATLYQAVVDDLISTADDQQGIGRSGAVLAGIAKLKQVCNHPAHLLGDGSPLPGRSGKLDRVEELLDEIVDVGDKVLCFTQFTEWGELLVGHLARRYGVEPLWLHGGLPRPRRDLIVERFSDPDGPQVFLLSLKAGGTGLNLTAASHVVHLDRWWNPAVEDQATDRAYRIGQRRTVQVHKLVTAGTIEERIDEMITAKRDLAERVVGSGEQWITKLSTAELREVVALRDPEVQ